MFEKTKSGLAALIKTVAQEVWEQLQPRNPAPTAESIPQPTPVPAREPTSLLTEAQREFMLRFYDYARRAAVRVAGRLGVEAQVVDDLLESAATDALIAVAKRSTEPDFVGGKEKCFLLTAIYRQVRNALAKFYGWGAERPSENTLRGLVEFVGGSRFPNPLEEAIRHEEEELRSPAVLKAKALMGEFDDLRRTDGMVSEFEVLKSKLRRFGLSCKGRVEELRERLADYLRKHLDMPTEVGHRDRFHGRVSPRRPSLAADQTDPNVRFVIAWERLSSVRDVAEALGSTIDAVKTRACALRREGVNLKLMPRGRRMVARTVSRAVLTMSPCRN